MTECPDSTATWPCPTCGESRPVPSLTWRESRMNAEAQANAREAALITPMVRHRRQQWKRGMVA